ALVITATTASAHAETAQMRVRMGDLDLKTEAGAHHAPQRIKNAARPLCEIPVELPPTPRFQRCPPAPRAPRPQPPAQPLVGPPPEGGGAAALGSGPQGGRAARRDGPSFCGQGQKISNSPAAPIPPPMHMVTTPSFAPRRLPSYMTWPTQRAPVMPYGWPME